jgi:Zn-finger nucleic acid-binding protein
MRRSSIDKFKMTCPDCGAVVITDSPKALTWELCPSCRRHIWDAYDVLMAEVYSSRPQNTGSVGLHQAN